MSYTVHFIAHGDDWKLHNKCLQSLYLPEDHNATNLSESLTSTLDFWSLSADKQSCITTDNGSNILCAVRNLSWTHLPCFGHNLHLAISNSIKGDARVSRALGVARKIVTTFSHSWKKKRDMKELQGAMDIPKHSLVTVSIICTCIIHIENVTDTLQLMYT